MGYLPEAQNDINEHLWAKIAQLETTLANLAKMIERKAIKDVQAFLYEAQTDLNNLQTSLIRTYVDFEKLMRREMKKHPGFKAVQDKIAAKEGLSKKAAGAILAKSSRNASKAAKKANPRLKKVK